MDNERTPLLASDDQRQLRTPDETALTLNLAWHEEPMDVVWSRLDSCVGGLSDDAAKQLLKFHGKNCLTPPKQMSLFMQFCVQLISGFGILLWAAALLCFIAWKPLGNPPDPLNLTLAICLVGVIVVQALFNLYQEFSSRKVMESLAALIPTEVNVFRGNVLTTISPQDLVIGDVVELRSGTLIPADIRLFHVTGMKVDASSLTGESDAITCTTDVCSGNIDIDHAPNMALFGTTVVDGQGMGVVIATGDKTRLGATVKLATSTETKATPLQLEIRRFVIIIAVLSLLTGLITYLVWQFHLRTAYPNFLQLSDILVNVISLIVAYVPEGMPVAVTVTLRLVAQKMRAQNLLVRSLTSVETLGSVTVIASDKTGTITMNMMTVRAMVFGLHLLDTDHLVFNRALYGPIWRAVCLCNGAADFTHGDATDKALLRLYERYSPEGTIATVRQRHKELARIPFNSRNKWMLTINKVAHDHGAFASTTVFMKGAFEFMLERSSHILDENGAPVVMSEHARKQLLDAAKQLAGMGRRVIAIAHRELDESFPDDFHYDTVNPNFPMTDLCLMAIFGLEDPPRPSVKRAVESCRSAGIRVFMVTGDHPETAIAISKEVTLITANTVDRLDNFYSAPTRRDGSDGNSTNSNSIHLFHGHVTTAIALTGADLERMGDNIAVWDWALSHDQIVFARTSPDQKLRIVQQLQKRNNIVAVTGDGVNDAAAIKCADVGLAMGSGTDAAKQAAGMILLDDSFSAIVAGVESGRTVYENLKKVILYLLPAGSWSEMLPVIACVFFGMPQPLSSFQMIMICMLTDIFPSMSMVYEPPESDIMKRPPRNTKTERLVTARFILFAYGNIGMFESFAAFSMFFYYMHAYAGFNPGDLIFAYDKWNGDAPYMGTTLDYRTNCLNVGQSVFFVTLVIVQFGNALSIRTRRVTALPHAHPVNIYMLAGICCSLAIALLLVSIPSINNAFNTAPIPWHFWLIPFAAAFLLIVWDETRKYCVRNNKKILSWMWW